MEPRSEWIGVGISHAFRLMDNPFYTHKDAFSLGLYIYIQTYLTWTNSRQIPVTHTLRTLTGVFGLTLLFIFFLGHLIKKLNSKEDNDSDYRRYLACITTYNIQHHDYLTLVQF
jgi:hypothetical protein